VNTDRLRQQMEFILEIDKMKNVFRRTMVIESGRNENDAEHSWHLAVMAILLAEHVDAPGVDLLRVLKIVLVHDIVEIDAGDTYCYDKGAARGKLEREMKAADRIFGLLPEDEEREMRALWDEFEARKTPESRFANALDRLQPLLLNYHTRGRTWQRYGVRSDQVGERARPIGESSRDLWDYASRLIEDAVSEGILKE
jgi:putative hydrolase of HD superfamily